MSGTLLIPYRGNKWVSIKIMTTESLQELACLMALAKHCKGRLVFKLLSPCVDAVFKTTSTVEIVSMQKPS